MEERCIKMNIRELIKILRSANNTSDIDKYREDIITLIPQTKIMIDFNQQNYAHQYDLWNHSLQTVVNLPGDINDDMVYLAALLHDIGKPDCQTADMKDGKINMHYYGHPERSYEIVKDDIDNELTAKGERLTDDEMRRLLYYIRFHDDRVSLRMKHLRRHLRMGVSLAEFQNLMKLEVADARAHVMLPIIEQRIEICEKLSGDYGKKLYEDILAGK